MTAELMRLLQNIHRIGVVDEIDTKLWRVRVVSGELKTDWLRWDAQRAGAFKIWSPPSIGEEVLLACIGGSPETAIIICSLYSNANPAPGNSVKEIVLTAPDGATFKYDADAGALTASGMKTATLTASVSVKLNTPLVECSSHLKAQTFELVGGGSMKGNITHTAGSFSSNGVVVHTHTHGGVDRGSSSTDGPK